MAREVAILGGGMAGLETAVALTNTSKPPLSTTVFERGSTRYRGDKKITNGPHDGWGNGGGLAEDLGGRSRKYQGVLLGISDNTLKTWPAGWEQRLNGRYEQIRHHLHDNFPEIEQRHLDSAAAVELNLQHVPQGARLDTQTGELTIYSPYNQTLELAKTGTLRLASGKVRRVIQEPSGLWTVEIVDAEGKLHQQEGFAACVLSASAIGNIQILAKTLQQEIKTKITDHFSIGAIVHLPPGEPIEEFRHERLWSGYIEIPELGTNVFVQEMHPLENTGRMLDICAVIEQGSDRNDYSQLTVIPSKKRNTTTSVETNISQKDKIRLETVKQRLVVIINSIAQGIPANLTDDKELSYEEAVLSSLGGPAGSLSWYSFPYGAFEHESGTHAIGDNGLFTVTNDLEIEGLPGLYVAGPGNFPRLGAENPALTILATSHELADTIHERYA